MTPDEHASLAGMFRLLARIWSREIDQEFLDQLSADPLREAFLNVGGILPNESVDDLAIEYCLLFIGPAEHLPPYQSVWQTGQFQGETTTSMEQFVDVIGYDTSNLDGMMLDHLGVQLDVMNWLEQNQAETPLDSEKAVAIKQIHDEFFARHLAWPTKLIDAATEKTTSDFYRSVFQITRSFLESAV